MTSMSERWQSDQGPKVTGGAPRGYDATPAAGVRVSTVSTGGRVIGLLWSDSSRAAGYVHAPDSSKGVRASGPMWTVAKALYDAGENPDAVLDATHYPQFDVQMQPHAYGSVAEGCAALLGT